MRIIRGEWCIVAFKFEKLGVFCFVCGCLGHTEQKCEVLFDMDANDGTRGLSADLRPDFRTVESSAGGRWLREEKGGQANPSGWRE